jgi:seryl-tRNA synthetase
MLDIKWIRENPEALDRALKNRNWFYDEEDLEFLLGEDRVEIESLLDYDERRGLFVQAIVKLDEQRRLIVGQLQQAQERRNAASKEIGVAKASRDEVTAKRLTNEVATLKEELARLDVEREQLDKDLDNVLKVLPNIPLEEVPVGDETANREYRVWGTAPGLNGTKDHSELGEAIGGMDFEVAAKLSGSRFVVLKGQLARMERALGQFMLDLHTTEHGYVEVAPPLLVRENVLVGTAQLPKFADDQFTAQFKRPDREVVADSIRSAVERAAAEGIPAEADNFSFIELVVEEREKIDKPATLWLIPTAEVPLTNLVREQILDNLDQPLRYTALTPCFRSEAGAAGKDTRGMLRQHQFDKVELVSITTPEQSREEHERMLVCAEEVLKRLDLHYRVMVLSTGDMGFASQKTYDIEVWLPGQGTYREISSCSVCGDFQARRMNARFRPKGEKNTRFVHTLNGSGVAVGRALIAVMENYQNPDGSIAVPEALRPYMGGMEKIG